MGVEETQAYPGVAKFGIALEWGSRGLEFESRHSDQKKRQVSTCRFFSEINPCGICEMHFVREIRLRRVKCLRA